MNTTSGKITLY